MIRKQLGLVVLLAMSAVCAQAEDETGKWYLNPQIGFLWADNDRHIDNDIYYGLGIGKHVSTNWSLEANALFGNYRREAGGNQADIYAYSFDALRVFNRESRVSPFISAGVGYIEGNPTPGHYEGNPLVQVGAGLLLDVAENNNGYSILFQIRPEVKARWDAINYGDQKDHIDYMAGVGFQFAFGPARRAPAPAVVAAPVAAAPVVTPPPTPVVVPPPPPADTDGDGVSDPRDQCPGTPRGEPVDAMGCGFQVRLSVQFENDSAKLKPESLPELDTAAALLNRIPSITAVIEGHTDSVGDAAYNEKLSQRRAQAVTDYLVGKGVGSSRLQAKGFGESQPIADNSTADGRAQNRRVIMRRTDATK